MTILHLLATTLLASGLLIRELNLLGLVGLSGFGARYSTQLSGGMQQRVEIARVLPMDEPICA